MDRKYLFEEAPVFKALASFAIPTIISQLISMIYNMADMMFIGKANNPYMVAATSLSFVFFMALNALGQLFGVGGGVTTSTLMGEYKEKEAREVGTFCFYNSLIICFVYSTLILIFMDPMLRFLGASDLTIGFARQYTLWVVVVGGYPTILSLALCHLIRSEGYSKEASFGLTMGGIINIILDPIFMFVILKPGQEVQGAAMATMVSNVCVMIYFFFLYNKLKAKLYLTLDIKNYKNGTKYLKRILSIGFPSFIGPFLGTVSSGAINRLCTSYSDIAVAAFGIAKKIDMLPMNTALGLAQGMVPLVAYNYSNKNYKRMRGFINAARFTGMGFAVVCIVIFQLFTPQLVQMFIKEPETVAMGVKALRAACLAVPFMIFNFQMAHAYQAMRHGMRSFIISACRQAIVFVPILYIMNGLLKITGIYYAQLVSDFLVFAVTLTMYLQFMRKLDKELEKEMAEA
ncbi:MAG: MATE family efflux transporter [Clostridia bacterium]|nr:MATE family efflux transporter [Clostridia bacterium]